VNTAEVKLAYLQKKLDATVEDLELYLAEVKANGSPADYHKLSQLLLTTLQAERRWTLSSLYLGEALSTYAERVAENSDDTLAAGELTSLLKAV
jgi:hypothetical protein